jgi:hypothetical protein
MLYTTLALNVLVLILLGFELYGNRRERQSLALLIKSRDVQEFVRAEQQLADTGEPKEPEQPAVVPLDTSDPNEVAAALDKKQ